ncbi:caspase family protein [Floridanema evergladense]|uniref:Caspase family protein n=1 Tax=Floridaenema evergladense BLCC-F167 TaxID=3153639 RepID=A0ABV4WF61_9CYAN
MSPVSVGTSKSKDGLKTSSAKLWILLIGVNQYEDNNLPSLQHSALDCQGLGEALADATQAFPQKEVFIHHDFAANSPNTATVRNSLNQIISAANPQDTVLFYFSGHGILEPKTQEAILCLKDSQSDDPVNTGLRLPELLQLLDNCNANQQLVWLDACHSGGMILRGLRGETVQIELEHPQLNTANQMVETFQKRANQSRKFYALLSCDRNQRSWEFPELGHGVFTYYLMRGLRGEAADAQGVIDADGLYKYVYHQTLQYIDKTNQQLRLINQQKRSRGETQLHPEYTLQTPKRIVEGVGELILGMQPHRHVAENRRVALVVDGLSSNEKTLALSKVLRQRGNFELEYWSKSGKDWSGLKEAMRTRLRSHNISSQESAYNISVSPDPETTLLYLRARLEQTEVEEPYLIFADKIKISRSWLRQELRKSKFSQQIVILDCPGATFLPEWIEDLQLGAERGQCLIAAAGKLSNSEQFTQALLETLNAADKQVGLPIAGWISRLQIYLAGTDIALHIWLSGAKGVIEVLPENMRWLKVETTVGLDLGLCPYKGLQAFSEEDVQFFYGRENLTQQLINELNHCSFLAVIGASGSGKSSIVHAGLIPQFRQGKQLPGSEQWWIKSLRPGANPLETLSWRLVDATTEKEQVYQQMQLEAMLYQGVEGFVRWLRDRSEPMVVLIIDQFEELFTLATAEDRKSFLEIILGALDYAADRFKLIITLRADFISSCLEVPALSEGLQKSSVLVPPYLTKDDYRQAIVMPAEKVGLKIESQLVEVLLQELDRSAGELPLLQFVLEQLWFHRHAGELTLEAYQHKIGGIQGALERKAQAIYDSLDNRSKDCAKWIFLNLTQLGEGTEDTRRRVLKSELIVEKYPANLVEKTLQALTAAKLVVMNSKLNESVVGSSRGEDTSTSESLELTLERMKQEVTVEIAHEVLIRHWSMLRWWLEENRVRLRVQRQIEQAAMLWKENNKKADFLLQGVRLAEAEDIYIKYTDELSADTLLFIDACLQERERQKFELKRRLRQAQTAVGVISILALGALGLGYLAYQQSRTAQIREIEALNSLSENYFLSNQQLEALVTSVKAGRQLRQMIWLENLFPTITQKTLQAKTADTLQKVFYQIRESNRLEQHTDEVFSVVFSPDGQTLASASADKTVKLWRLDGHLLRSLNGHKDRVWGVSFSHDGKLIASASEDRTIKIWRSSDGQLLRTFNGHSAGMNFVSFSSDNQVIASASKDTIKLWRISDGQLLKTLKEHSDIVMNVNFSPDSKLIVSASLDGTIKIWRSNDGQLIRTLKGHKLGVLGVSFSPDGKIIASASADRTVKIWQTSDGALLRTILGHNDEVNSVSFNPDGQILVSASRDNTIKLWQTKSGSLLDTFQGHSASVQSANFSPDGKMVASASRDKTIRLWKLNSNNLHKILQGHLARVNSVSFNYNGLLLASASDDRTIKIWQVSNGSLVRTLPENSTEVYSVSFSPDSKFLVSANKDGTVKLWQISNGSLLQTLKGHTDEVNYVTFSPDGQIIASASADKTIKLWQANNGSLWKTLRGHTANVQMLDFSPNGKIIASGSRDDTIKLWNKNNGKLITSFNAHSGIVYGLSFSPDGIKLASANHDNTVKIWHRNGSLLQTFRGHQGYVWDVNFSPDGKLIASASEDRTVKLWRTNDGKLLRTFDGYQAGVTSVRFSPNGKTLASASSDSTIVLWNLEGAELQKLDLHSLLLPACLWLHDYLQTNSKLSQQERQLCSSSGF